MGSEDGSVIIRTEVDDKQAQRELAALERKIESLQDKLSAKKNSRDAVSERARAMGAELDAAKAKLAKMQSGESFFTADSIKQQQSAVAETQKEWNAINDRLDKQNAKLREDEAVLSRMVERAGRLKRQIGETGKNADKIKSGLDKASDGMESFSKRVAKLAKRALVFTVIAQALSKLRSWLSDVVMANDDARQAVAQLKGALLTLAQPLLQIIIPAFTTLVRVLTAVVSLIANAVSALFGTTAKGSAAAAKSLNDQKNALKVVGSAAKSASKQLAGFDEINKISNDSGAGSGGASTIAPDFGFADTISPRLKEIAKDVLLIGAGLALWKISEKLPGQLGDIGVKVAGIAIALGGLMLMVDGLKKAWADGVDWENFTEILLGATAAAGGLYLAFGKVGAGIALVVAGAAMIVTAFNDIIKNGANLQNTLLLIAGIVATGLGFFLLTGNIIPLVIAGIAGIVVAVLALTGNLEEFCKNFKDNILGGLIDFISGVFSGDWEKAWGGIKKVFKGVWNSIVMILESAVNLIIKGINWLISQLNKIHFNLPDWVPGVGGKSFGINIPAVRELKIPRLAQGAVIPANREFLAVLGDQKSGTNIEAPLDTIKQAVAEVLGQGGDRPITIVVQMDSKEVFRQVVRENNAQVRMNGKSPLLV